LYFIYIVSLVFLVLTFWTHTLFQVCTVDLENIKIAACLLSGSTHPSCLLTAEQELGALSMIRSYPPWSLPIISLFSFGTLEQLKTTWLLISSLGFAVSTALITYLFKNLQQSLSFVYPIFFCILWYPVYTHLVIGQLTVIQLLCFVAFLILYKNNSYYLSGILLSLTAIKPQTLWLLYLVLFLSLKREHLKILVAFVATTVCLSLFGFYLKSEIATGFWPVRLEEVTAIVQPNLGSMLQLYFSPVSRFIPAILISIFTMCYVLSRKPANILNNPSLIRILTLSFLFSPYIGVHDMIIYIVPLLYLVSEAKTKLSDKDFTVFVASLLLCLFLIFAVILKTTDLITIGYFVFLPLLVQIVFECFYLALRKYQLRERCC
jgi:hypothetical protein